MFQEQLFDANGVKINFAQVSDSGKPVVLLHGAGAEWQSFLPLIPTFARDYRVYALDLRGHGRSSRSTEGYRVLDYAKDVQWFLEQHIAEPAILYGHSLGALTTIATAAQTPAWVRAAILGDPPFYFHNMTTRQSMWYEPFMELHNILSTMHSAQEMDDYMAEHYPNMEPQRRKARAETMLCVDPSVIAVILEGRDVEGFDTDALLRQIICPVLLLRGDVTLGSALREEDVTYMTERLQNCEVVPMREVGHGLPIGESLSRVEAFLKSVSV